RSRAEDRYRQADAPTRSRAEGPLPPSGRAALERLQVEQTDAGVGARRVPRRLRVVAPGREEESDVVEIGVGGHVLGRLQPALDEPQARSAPLRGGEGADELAEVVALVGARLLALDVGQPESPVVEDAPRELAFLRRHEHRALWLRDQPAQLIDRGVR